MTRDGQTLHWQQHQPFAHGHFPARARWQPANGEPQPEQAVILQQLLDMPPGVAAVTAARGRGKSALAGQLISRMKASAIVTAPAKRRRMCWRSLPENVIALWRQMRYSPAAKPLTG